MTGFLAGLECTRCSDYYPGDTARAVCDCGSTLLVRYDLASVRKAVTPGDQLHIEVIPLRKGKIFKMKGEIKVDGNVVSSAEFLAGLAEKSKVQ